MSKLAFRPAAVVLALAFVAWLGAVTVAASAGIYRLHRRFASEPAIVQLWHYLTREPLIGEAQGRINVLLLGIAATDQVGRPLADSILLVSLFPDERKAAVLSVPRDLSIVFPDGALRKVNEAYDFTGAGEDRGGPAKRILGVTLGVPIHYYAAIDIGGMESLIDAIGGVWVEVDRPFVAQPKAGYAQTVFAAGRSWMNGHRALHFARARYATNGEGSDFARSARQQKLLVAVLDRLKSWRTVLNPLALWRVADALAASLDTDLEPWQVAALRRLLGRAELERLPQSVLRDVLQPVYDAQGTFRLLPREATLAPIQHRVRQLAHKPLLTDLQAAIDRDCDPAALASMTSGGNASITPRLSWDHSATPAGAASQTVRGIVVHHDGVAHPRGRSGAEKVAAVLQSVRVNYAWEDIPYHYLIDVDGTIFAGAQETTATRTRSWHDPSNLLHIALLGDYSSSNPTAPQIESLLRLIRDKAAELSVPASRIHLHSELAATDCPGSHVRERLQPPPWCPARAPRDSSAATP